MFGFLSSRRSKIIREAEAQGFKFAAYTPATGSLLAPVDAGLLILSRLPIAHFDWKVLPLGLHADRYLVLETILCRLASKSLLYAEVMLSNEQSLHLVTTHLQATPSLPHDQYRRIREEQVKAIVKYIDTFLANKNPILLVGDFNINSLDAHDDEFPHIFKTYFPQYKDLLLLNRTMHEVTFGDGPGTIHSIYDQVLTSPHDLGTYQAIDHAFLNDQNKTLKIDSAKINPFILEGTNLPVTHISGSRWVSFV